MSLAAGAGKAGTIFVHVELSYLSALVAFRMWKLLLKQVLQTCCIIWETLIELLNGD